MSDDFVGMAKCLLTLRTKYAPKVAVGFHVSVGGAGVPGGTAGHYRNNHVHYFFGHVGEMIAAGGAGMVYGVGAANQTFIDTDNSQFKNAVSKYFASPIPIP